MKITYYYYDDRFGLRYDRKDEIFLFDVMNRDKILTIKYDDLCQQVFDLDSQVRFVGVANSKGELVSGGLRDNVETMLVDDELKMSIHYALQKRDLYTNLAYKIGFERSSITEYDKVTMISIPINSSELFMISTEPRANYLKIIDHIHSVLASQQTAK